MIKMLAVSGGVLSVLGGLALLVKSLGNLNLRLTLDHTRAEDLPVRSLDVGAEARAPSLSVRMTRGEPATASPRPASPVVVESARTEADGGTSEAPPVRPHLSAEPRSSVRA